MLDRLKPAWRLYILRHSMTSSFDREEVLALLENAEGTSDALEVSQVAPFSQSWHLSVVVLFLLLTCCYGG